MAESQAVTEEEDQLTCAGCHDGFKDPKLLQCFHVYCKDCLQEQLNVEDHQGQLSLRCPTCRQSTLLPPATAVSGLQSAFHVHHLLEIKDALEKVKEPQKVKCDKCKPLQPATSYCCDCGEFICAVCTAIHSRWDAFAKHEVVALEDFESKIKQLDTLRKVTLYCALHKDKKLKLYCETCQELICSNCTVKKHKDHQFDLVSDTFDGHKAEILTSTERVKEQLDTTSKALTELDIRSKDLDDQQASTKEKIRQEIQEFHKVIEARGAELIRKVEKYVAIKKKNLVTQRCELEKVHAQLTRCLSFVSDSLKRGSEGEVMKMKKGVMEQVKEMTDNFKQELLPPCETANVKYGSALPSHVSQLQQFGNVFLQQEKCVDSNGLEVAETGERSTSAQHIVDYEGAACAIPVEGLTCQLVTEATGEKKKSHSVTKTGDGKYEIHYQPMRRGRHQLHITIEGVHIKGRLCPVTVNLSVQKPIKVISEIVRPWGIAVNKKGEIIVAEANAGCISVFSQAGKKLRSFGSKHSGLDQQFSGLRGVTVDADGNILVVDIDNHCIQMFASDGKLIKTMGKKGSKPQEFDAPMGIATHAHRHSTKKSRVFVADMNNHRIQILNADLTFSSTFGDHGSDNGQFEYPWDVACDSAGSVYVADKGNHRIQVFTAKGEYVRHFGSYGSGEGELNSPIGIAIDRNDNVVYVTELGNHRVSVFTSDGKVMTSFGSKGNGAGQFDSPRGVAVDKSGTVYVSDTDNKRLQIF